ncbi:MAG: hypothetical protein ACM3KR_02285 [Deltaproteobacteria bacterium]
MKKRSFLLSFLFTVIVLIVSSFSCMAMEEEVVPEQESNGLTIHFDGQGNAKTFTSPYNDVSGGNIKYRTTVKYLSAYAYSVSPTGPNQNQAPIAQIENVQADPTSSSGIYTGELPGDIKFFLNSHRGNYCKVVFHPIVEAYFASATSYGIPAYPMLSPNSTYKFDELGNNGNASNPHRFDDDTLFWQHINAQSRDDCTTKFNGRNPTGFHFADGSNYGPGVTAHKNSYNGVIEYYDQEGGVYGSYIGWASTPGNPFATFEAIDSRFTNTSYLIPPKGPTITFQEWTGPGTFHQETDSLGNDIWVMDNPLSKIATNTISFKYKVDVQDIPKASYTGQDPRSKDFLVAIYKKVGATDQYIDRTDMLDPNSAVYDSNNQRYLAPSSSTGRSNACNEVILKANSPYTVSFNLNTSSLADGVYKISVIVNDASNVNNAGNNGIEPYDPPRHHSEFLFTIGSGLNLAITDINASSLSFVPGGTYTATAKYSVMGKFPAGAKVRGYLFAPGTSPYDSQNLITSDEYAAKALTEPGRSGTAVPLDTEGSNYVFSFPFTIPTTYTADKFTLRAEIIPEAATPPEINPYQPYPDQITDNVKQKDFSMNKTRAVIPVAYDLGIYPATEKLKYFTNQVRVNAYWLPTGAGTFDDKTWRQFWGTNTTFSTGITYNGEPIIGTKAKSTNGADTLSGTGFDSGTNAYTLFCDQVNIHNPISIFTTDASLTENLNCQTTLKNKQDFGKTPDHQHIKTHDYGDAGWDGPDEGGCKRLGK